MVAEELIEHPPRRGFWGQLRRRRDWRIGALVVAAILCIASVAFVIFILLEVVPTVWKWGFDPSHTGAVKVILGILGTLGAVASALLAFLPLMSFGFLWRIVTLYFDDAEDELKQKLDKTKAAQHEAEEQLKDFEKDDPSGLIQLVQYSRLQLDQYYTIAIRQTQQSFRYSIVAMWIGFVVMIGGLLPFVLPFLKTDIKIQPNASVNVIISAGGFVIELIAALFLWVYRSSIAQLTYFYNRQIHLHNVLLCYKIAATMKPDQEPKALDVKSLIIQKVLDSTWSVERPESPNAKGIKDLLGSTPSSTASSTGSAK